MSLAPVALVGAIAMTMGGSPTTAPVTGVPRTPAPVDAGIAPTSVAATAPASTGESAPEQYTVIAGDTVSGIAARYGLATTDVLARNGLDWSSLIFPGQVLQLIAAPAPQPAEPAVDSAPIDSAPGAGAGHTVVAGDTVSGIAASAGVSAQAVLDANGLGWTSIIYPGQVLVVPSAAPAAMPPAIPPIPASLGVVPLSDEMHANALVIVGVGRRLGVSDQGLVVALAAAAQESGLRNVQYGDLDSLGLFQQRPSRGWGSDAEVLDPVRASHAFFGGPANPNAGRTRGLLDIGGWESMTVTAAAQAVQISAYPDAYAKWEESARAWLAALG